MNKVFKENEKYYFENENQERFEVKTWFEKKSNIMWIVLPKDNLSGRTYISLNKLVNDKYEFENKTSGPRVLSSWNWKNRMSEEEKIKYEECQNYIEWLRNECMTRKPVELSEKEKVELEIKKLQEKLKKLKG